MWYDQGMTDLNKTVFRAAVLTANDLRKFYEQAFEILNSQGCNPTPEIRAYVKACRERHLEAEKSVDELMRLI